jgi:probable rRNA maturation factor
MISVEVDNRSGVEVDEPGAVELAGRVLRSEGVEDGELGIAFVGEDEMRTLKREHLSLDQVTDVLSFPIDGRDDVPAGVPRALGDVVLCPTVAQRQGEVAGHSMQAELELLCTHGILHLLGFDHAEPAEETEMFGLQRDLLASWRSAPAAPGARAESDR